MAKLKVTRATSTIRSITDTERIKQNVSFDPDNYAYIQGKQQEWRLGGRGFSAALNRIILEHATKEEQPA